MAAMDPFMGEIHFNLGLDFLDSTFDDSELLHGDEPDFVVTRLFNSTVDNLIEDELKQTFTSGNIIEDLSDEKIQEFITGNKSKETKYKDKSSINRLHKFMKSMEPPDARSVLKLCAKELDTVLCHFFINAKKVDELSIKKLGKLYQPDTLSSFRNAWQRYLSDNGSKFNIKTDKEFERSRKVLASRRKQLTLQGLGNKPNTTRPLTDVEVDYLFETNYFGNTSPISLQRAVWWKITTNFGYRGRDESRKLCYGDIKLCSVADGTEFLEWDVERGSKTRSGEMSGAHQRSFNPRAHSIENKQQCPVVLYKEFVKRRPISSCQLDAPFFLAMIPKERINSNAWYYDRPLGKNLIGEFLSKATTVLKNCPMSSVANDIEQSRSRSKVANHSARKTAITTLLNNNVNPLHVSQLSGHKSTESLKSYHTASSLQQRQMSDLINRSEQQSSSASSSRQVLQTVCTNDNNNSNSNGNKRDSLFNGATIQNCTFNINNYFEQHHNNYKKRRRILCLDSDSDQEN